MRLPYIKEFIKCGRPHVSYRRAGFNKPLHAKPGSEAFAVEYAEAARLYEVWKLTSQPIPKASTLKGLCASYLLSDAFNARRPSSQGNYRRTVNWFADRHGHHLIDRFGPTQVRQAMAGKAGKPSAGADVLQRIKTVWQHGLDAGMVSPKLPSPFEGIKKPERPARKRPTWTAQHTEQFCRRWPLGSQPYLV